MYRLDIWVDRKVIIDVKSVEQVLPVHAKQVLTYLQQTKSKLGLLLNFNVPVHQGWYSQNCNGTGRMIYIYSLRNLSVCA